MAEWKWGYDWGERRLEKKLEEMRGVGLGFTGDSVASGEMWNRYYTEATIARAAPRSKESAQLELAWKLLQDYQFSDPAIVKAHFNPKDALLNRTLLLEIRVLGLSFICGTRITRVLTEQNEKQVIRAFRYDTLKGHLEQGSEWFWLTHDRETGEIKFRIEASWRMGEFPNLWSRAGFSLLGRHYQLAWHRLAYLRMRSFLNPNSPQTADTRLPRVERGRRLVHTGAELKNPDLWIIGDSVPTLGKIAATRM